jgi:hypothetical protein
MSAAGQAWHGLACMCGQVYVLRTGFKYVQLRLRQVCNNEPGHLVYGWWASALLALLPHRMIQYGGTMLAGPAVIVLEQHY